jgi:cytochrome c-type biogenesis protein CcmH/NrfF
VASPASTSEPAGPPGAEQLAVDVADTMPSPYCPGRTISSCPSEAARELEQDILAQARSGKTREEIETGLVQRFGSEVMGQAYSFEVLLIVAASALLAIVVGVWVVRTWLRRDAPVAEAGGQGPSAAELDRLEDELDRVDGF